MKRFLATATLASLMAAPLSAATLTNGSFEQPGTYSGPFLTLNSGFGMLNGWRIESGSVDLINTLWQHSDGSYSLDLGGNEAGTISTLISDLDIGKRYRISFDMAANPASVGSVVKSLNLILDSDMQSYSFDRTGQTTSNMGWTTMHYDFYAASTDAVLAFSAAASDGAYGAALDNISIDVAPVPVPASALLLLTGFGAMAMRRKR